MFSGIVEAVGTVVALAGTADCRRLTVVVPPGVNWGELGQSVAVSGVCLTLVATDARQLGFDVGPETIARTTLGELGAGTRVNLERPLRYGAPVGGHLVQGHVDRVGMVVAAERVESSVRLRVNVEGEARPRPLVPQGSVAVDGVSLTVAALGEDWFEAMLIPHTLSVTTLGALAAGARVNLEFDILGKYARGAAGAGA